MKYLLFTLVMIAAVPVYAYPNADYGMAQMASDAAVGRGDYSSACRHAVIAAHAMNLRGDFDLKYMRVVGDVCSKAWRIEQ